MAGKPLPDRLILAQEALFEEGQEQFWKTVIDTMMDGLLVVDVEGVILSVNLAMEQITGYSRNELIGQPCTILKCHTCLDSVFPGGRRECELFRRGSVRRRKCVLERKDGTPLPVMKNAAVLKDRSGKVVAGVENLTDLSEVEAKERVISHLRRELSREEVSYDLPAKSPDMMHLFISRLRQELNQEDAFHGIIGRSPVMVQLFTLISSAAQSEAPVVIYGESGTGKELVAAAIHRLSPRCQGPFIKVNSAALNESLLESELFGHVKGAFTGADRTRVGRFEAANGGDIFLDEVGDLPMPTQAKLLRVLQEKIIEKVGDHAPIPVNVRVITATNKDLHRLMASGRFREDLFYRIGVIPIHLPPLRERREDIPLLVKAFINRARRQTRKPLTGVSDEVLGLLNSHDWPGNVRELINVIEYAFVLCAEGTILPEHLPASFQPKPERAARVRPATRAGRGLDERQRLIDAINEAGGKKSEAARLLGISRVTLWKLLKAHDIQVDKIIRG
ncbi:MAG: sigma 54-interacting transcriptional regulator [Syntrophobacterales bacterium]|jgi:PAS domain S-box-containing protein|nr:sigma 54-interacting transcriptional regulator [Syntrophobacterales bacterium]